MVIFRDNSIPSTLEECYVELDAILLDEEISDIRNAGNGNLFKSGGFPDGRWDELIDEGFDPVDLDLSAAHFGLGLWIRNSWIYPSPYSNIASKLLMAGIRHPDDMSSIIVSGYYQYLNDLPYGIPIKASAIVAYSVIALILALSMAFLIVGKYKEKGALFREGKNRATHE